MGMFIMSVDGKDINGFTLVELLVALLVSSFLLIILFDGLLTSISRNENQLIQRKAISLAQEKLSVNSPANSGFENGLQWRVSEEIIARSPRGQQALVKRVVVINKDSNPIINLEKRYLRAGQ